VPVPVIVLLIVRFSDLLYWSVPLLVTPPETVPPLSSCSVAPEEMVPPVQFVV
jgi:hypothetical protein